VVANSYSSNIYVAISRVSISNTPTFPVCGPTARIRYGIALVAAENENSRANSKACLSVKAMNGVASSNDSARLLGVQNASQARIVQMFSNRVQGCDAYPGICKTAFFDCGMVNGSRQRAYIVPRIEAAAHNRIDLGFD
jgi:hypothetical protein